MVFYGSANTVLKRLSLVCFVTIFQKVEVASIYPCAYAAGGLCCHRVLLLTVADGEKLHAGWEGANRIGCVASR